MNLRHLAAIFLVIAILILFLQPSAFSFNSGNWYYAEFTQNPGANSGSCNFSQAFYAFNFAWKAVESAGLSFKAFWFLLSLLIALVGVYLQYKWVELASGSRNIAFAASFLSFILLDLWTPVMLPAPRHVAFFILMPLAYWSFFKIIKNSGEKPGESSAQGYTQPALLALLTAALAATHVLFAAFFLLSIAFYYIAKIIAGRSIPAGFKRIAIALLIGLLISSPLLYQQILAKSASTPSASYSKFKDWGITAAGFWIPSPSKVFYSKSQVAFLSLLIILSLFAAWNVWKRKEGEMARTEFELFTAANVILGLLVYFTPLGNPLAILFMPGVFVEQFLKLVPFYLAVPLALFQMSRSAGSQSAKQTVKQPAAQAASRQLMQSAGIWLNANKAVIVIAALVIAYPAYFYFSSIAKPIASVEDYLGDNAKAIADEAQGGLVLSDFFSSYVLSSANGIKTAAVNPGYNVCLTNAQVQGIGASNDLYSGTLSKGKAGEIMFEKQIKAVYVNPRFWSWGLNNKTSSSGFAYPGSFSTAAGILRSYGLEEQKLPDGAVLFVKR